MEWLGDSWVYSMKLLYSKTVGEADTLCTPGMGHRPSPGGTHMYACQGILQRVVVLQTPMVKPPLVNSAATQPHGNLRDDSKHHKLIVYRNEFTCIMQMLSVNSFKTNLIIGILPKSNINST